MIYNQELTDNLKEIFGQDVLSWSKSKIRNELENIVNETHNVAMTATTEEDKNKAFNLYREFKAIDDEFTELYILELDSVT